MVRRLNVAENGGQYEYVLDFLRNWPARPNVLRRNVEVSLLIHKVCNRICGAQGAFLHVLAARGYLRGEAEV